MTVAVAISPESGSITHAVQACTITCSGAPTNTATGYSTSNYPTEPALVYYFKLAATGQTSLKSRTFSPNVSGVAQWDTVIFPAAGSWTLTLNNSSDDSVAATASVTVA